MEKDNQTYTAQWSQFKNGDKNAFASIYECYIHDLIAYGSRLCADEELLKDSIQDLFIELWNGRANLAEVECIKIYLFKALRYKLIRAEKTKISRREHMENVPGQASGYGRFESSVESAIIDQEMLDSQSVFLHKALSKLTKRQQEAIQLRFYQGFSNEQIGDLMGMNYQSVSNIIYTALSRIRKNVKTPAFRKVLAAAFQFFF